MKEWGRSVAGVDGLTPDDNEGQVQGRKGWGLGQKPDVLCTTLILLFGQEAKGCVSLLQCTTPQPSRWYLGAQDVKAVSPLLR